MKKILTLLTLTCGLFVNSQVIICHKIGTLPNNPNKSDLDYEKCREEFIISEEFKMATIVVYTDKGEPTFSETFELYDVENKTDEIIYTLKHSDSSDYKFTELKIYNCVDCADDEVMIEVTITKWDDTDFLFWYRAKWWALTPFKQE